MNVKSLFYCSVPALLLLNSMRVNTVFDLYLQRKYRRQEGESELADPQTAPEQVPIVTYL